MMSSAHIVSSTASSGVDGGDGLRSVPSQTSLSSLSAEDAIDCVAETYAVGEYRLSTCPICLERFTLTNPAVLVQCEHGFHLQCLESWRMRSPECPVCLRPLSQGEGTLMEDRNACRRRRRRHRVAATSAVAAASMRLDHEYVGNAMGTVVAEGEGGVAKAHDQRATHQRSGATAVLLTTREGADDNNEDDGEGERERGLVAACLGGVWGWLENWCGRR